MQEREFFSPKNCFSPVNRRLLNTVIIPRKAAFPRNLKRHPFNNYYKPMAKTLCRVPDPTTLDRNLLLQFSKVFEPSEAVQVKLINMNITEVNEKDLKQFLNLSKLDLSDNKIGLHQLLNLTNVVDLNLTCNEIKKIPNLSFKFEFLETLNLSFNAIVPDYILNLSTLPRLKVLDLSSNRLSELPVDMSAFIALRELSVNSNTFLDSSELFRSLSSIPKLNKLSIARNKLREIPEGCFFTNLKELDFSYNWVKREEDLSTTVYFSNLQLLVVTGNPILTNCQKLKNLLSTNLGATVIFKDKRQKAPYSKPLADLNRSAMKSSLFYIENNKNYQTVNFSSIHSTQEDEEVFPRNSPLIHSGLNTSSEKEEAFFVTEAISSPSKLNNFKSLAYSILGGNKTHNKNYNVQVAYKQLKYMIQNPKVIREPKVNMKPVYFESSGTQSEVSSIPMFNFSSNYVKSV